jgi:hypothetical protein
MSNCTTTTTSQCIECTHPFEYILEIVYQESVINVDSPFYGNPLSALDIILDKGVILPNCNMCCPKCNIYGLASVETILKLLAPFEGTSCCTNIYGSQETHLKFWETQLGGHYCCTGFHECIDELICVVGKNSFNTQEDVIELLLDKGIVEIDVINSKCNNSKSSICLLAELLNKYFSHIQSDILVLMLDRILDKGIIISCENGITVTASTETYLKYFEAV